MSTNDTLPLDAPVRLPFSRRGPNHTIIVMALWLLLVCLLAVVGTVAGLFMIHAVPGPQSRLEPNFPWVMVINMGVSALIFIAVSLHMGRVVGEGDRWAGLGSVPMQRPLLVVALVFAAVAVSSTIMWALDLPDSLNLADLVGAGRADDPPSRPWLLSGVATLVVVILAPIGEELFFRGWLWTELRRHWSPFLVMTATGMPFWLLHGTSDWTLLLGYLPATVAVSLLRHYCASVRASLAGHMLNNAIVMAAVFLA